MMKLKFVINIKKTVGSHKSAKRPLAATGYGNNLRQRYAWEKGGTLAIKSYYVLLSKIMVRDLCTEYGQS